MGKKTETYKQAHMIFNRANNKTLGHILEDAVKHPEGYADHHHRALLDIAIARLKASKS